MAGAFAPLLIVYAAGGRPRERVAIAMCLAGVATAFLWRQLGLSPLVYESLPAIAAGFVVFALSRLAEPARAGSNEA